jgi:hypothetical protein
MHGEKYNCYEGSKCCKCVQILFTTNIIREKSPSDLRSKTLRSEFTEQLKQRRNPLTVAPGVHEFPVLSLV